MIENDEALRRTHQAMLDLFLSLSALNQKQDSLQADWYATMAEPIIEHIFRLRREIDRYLGLPQEWQVDDEAEAEQANAGVVSSSAHVRAGQ